MKKNPEMDISIWNSVTPTHKNGTDRHEEPTSSVNEERITNHQNWKEEEEKWRRNRTIRYNSEHKNYSFKHWPILLIYIIRVLYLNRSIRLEYVLVRLSKIIKDYNCANILSGWAEYGPISTRAGPTMPFFGLARPYSRIYIFYFKISQFNWSDGIINANSKENKRFIKKYHLNVCLSG